MGGEQVQRVGFNNSAALLEKSGKNRMQLWGSFSRACSDPNKSDRSSRYLSGRNFLRSTGRHLIGNRSSRWISLLIVSFALAASYATAQAQTRPKSSAGKSAVGRAASPVVPDSDIASLDAARREANDNTVTVLATGRLTGHAQYAEDISNVFEGIKGNDLRVLPILGSSESKNVFDMLYLKGTDMAIVDRDILLYLKKSDPVRYKEIETKVNYITKLFNTALHVYARKDVKSLGDLRGKKISCLKEGSTIDLMCQNLFKILKIDATIVHDDFSSALQKVMTGEIAAAATGASPPVPGFEGIRLGDDLHFVPIDSVTLPDADFKSIWALYLPLRLQHGDYPNMIPEGQEIPTISTTTLLAVYAWPAGSAREQRVQRFVKRFFDNVRAFHQVPRHPKWKDLNLATEVKGWTRFPAAQTWLDEERKATAARNAVPDSEEAKIKLAFNNFLVEYKKLRGAPLEDGQQQDLYALFLKWWQTIDKQQQR
jgi:TRAP-type uncharacterized transport system substrate-binding protein